MTPALCVMTHYEKREDGSSVERERPTLAAEPSRLCPGHDARLSRDLADLPDLAVELDAQMIAAAGGGPKVSGTPGRALVGDLDAATHLRIIVAEMVGWCRVVHEERGAILPSNDSLSTLIGYMQRHHLWATEQPWVKEYATQLRDLHVAGRIILTAGRTRRVDLGPCDLNVSCDVVTGEEQTCEGILRATLKRDEDDLPPIVCSGCGTEHLSPTWRNLGRKLRKGQDSWMTGAQLSEALRVPWSTVRRWAVEDGWRSLDQRPRRYHADDAQRTFERRRAAPTAADVREARSA